MPRRVFADASPLIGLAAAGGLHLLRQLYDTVTITRAVRDEVMAGGGLPGARELDLAMRAGWIRVAPTPLETWRFAALDAGEASTLALAVQPGGAGAPLVLMDDALGREQAAALGLEAADVAAVLLAAKRAGLIDELRPMLERLARRGFTIPEESSRAALAAADEM